jgi:hypothetical protein
MQDISADAFTETKLYVYLIIFAAPHALDSIKEDL